MRSVTFHQRAFEDFTAWEKDDRKVYRRIVALISDALRHPFSGIGNPEPLKHELRGCWSRRINREHRLVYMVHQGSIVIVSCRYHYQS